MGSDHSALRWLMSFKEPTDQTARWIEILSQFNFEVIHRAGRSIPMLTPCPDSPVTRMSVTVMMGPQYWKVYHVEAVISS